MTDNFIFYRSFWEGLKDLPQDTMVRLVSALCEYALNDVEPDLAGLEKAVFTSWRANIDAAQKRRENGKRGGRPRKDIPEPIDDESEPAETTEKTYGFETENHRFSETKPNINQKQKQKYKENENDNSSRFRKPTVDEVRAYCQERKNSIDPEQFWNYYESKGWRVGKTPMKSWKACVVTWERYEKARDTPVTVKRKENPFLKMDNHEYDFEQLEKELLAN